MAVARSFCLKGLLSPLLQSVDHSLSRIIIQNASGLKTPSLLASCQKFCHSDSRKSLHQCSSQKLSTFESAKGGFSTSPAAIKYSDETSESSEVVERVNSQLNSQDVGRLFAVIHLGGLQRKVTTEDLVLVEKRIEADVGDRIILNKVLLVGSKDFTLLGRPVLRQDVVRIEATVVEKTFTRPIIRSYYRRRKKFRRFKLLRYPQSVLRINSIELNPLQSEDE